MENEQVRENSITLYSPKLLYIYTDISYIDVSTRIDTKTSVHLDLLQANEEAEKQECNFAFVQALDAGE